MLLAVSMSFLAHWREVVRMPSIGSREKYIQALKFAAEAHNGQTVPGGEKDFGSIGCRVPLSCRAAKTEMI